MIIVKLTGGLGNQLFQYAEGFNLAKERKTSLSLDISWYKGRLNRKYLLNQFNINERTANKFEIVKTKILNNKNYIETSHSNTWLTQKFAEQNESLIRREFTLKNNFSANNLSIMEDIQSKNSISIHLRGGDYVRGNKSNFHGVCEKEYYSASIEYIKSKIPSSHFYIFTDDIPWAKSHIDLPEPYTFVSNPESLPQEELILMSKCNHNIIANSTFSWWGAWLNQNPNKIVISPKKWFNNTPSNPIDLIPPTWIQM